MTHVEEATKLYLETTKDMRQVPSSVQAEGKSMLRAAANLDFLESAAGSLQEKFDAIEKALERVGITLPDKKPDRKKRKDQMAAQSNFSADGPALFMEGPRKRQRKNLAGGIVGVTKPLKVWVPPQDQPEKRDKRVLRLRSCGRGTTNP